MTPVRAIVLDLVADIHFSDRVIEAARKGKGVALSDLPAEISYNAKLRSRVLSLFRARHRVKLDPYGWPRLPEFR